MAQEILNFTEICRQTHFKVCVDNFPLGGYRGNAGAIEIIPNSKQPFTKWNKTQLNELSAIIQKSLAIYLRAKIPDVLIIGKQENKDFKLSLIPFPRTNIFAKINALRHAIFGAYSLNNKQISKIKNFLKKEFSKNDLLGFPNSNLVHSDHFCNRTIIQNQLINDVALQNKAYHVLHDNQPWGCNQKDIHFLIVPKEKEGHLTDSNHLLQQRYHLLLLQQFAVSILNREKHESIFFFERNGPNLQSVLHKHAQVIGIHKLPTTFFQKICTFLRILFARILSPKKLTQKIEDYKIYRWDSVKT